MTQLEATPPIAIDHDLPCAGCGYNLRSAPRDGVCSECGLVVLRSLGRDNVLWEARPGWLRSLSWGVWLMLAAQVTVFAVSYWGDRLFRVTSVNGVEWMLATYSVIIATYALGVWLLTRREHAFQTSSGKGTIVRRVARYTTFGMLVSVIGTCLAALSIVPETRVLGVAIIAGAMVFVVGVFATYLYLRVLARRVLSRRMAEYATIVAIGNGLSLGGFLVFFLVTVFTEWVPWEWEMIIMIVIGVPMLLFYLWSLLVLVMFAVAFAKASRQARQLWNEQPAYDPSTKESAE